MWCAWLAKLPTARPPCGTRKTRWSVDRPAPSCCIAPIPAEMAAPPPADPHLTRHVRDGSIRLTSPATDTGIMPVVSGSTWPLDRHLLDSASADCVKDPPNPGSHSATAARL